MLKVQKDFVPAHEVPQPAGERSRDVHQESAAARTRSRRRPAETVGLSELRNLSIFGVLWAGYLWTHVAGSIEMFGRP